jgi:hypothetical protein
MMLRKLHATPPAVLLAAVIGVWPAANPVAVGKAPVPKPAPREGIIVITIRDYQPAELFKPDGAPAQMPGLGAVKGGWKPRLSPDSRRLLLVQLGSPVGRAQPRVWMRNYLEVLNLDKEGSEPVVLPDVFYASAVWSGDGAKLYGSSIDPEKSNIPQKRGQPSPLVSWVFDPETRTTTPLALPTGHRIADVSPDGTMLLTVLEDDWDGLSNRTYLVPLATLKPQLLMEEPLDGMRFSPDGRRVIGTRYKMRKKFQLVTVTLADRSEEVVRLPDEVRSTSRVCWSPDSKRIAYVWYEDVPPPVPPGPFRGWYVSRVNVADPDGSNAKTIIHRKPEQVIEGIDWR